MKPNYFTQLVLGVTVYLTIGADAFAAGKRQKIAASPEAATPSSTKADAGFVLSPWLATESLVAKSFEDPLFPEKSVVLDAKTAQGTKVWNAMPEWRDGVVQPLKTGASTSSYMYRTLTVAKAGALRLSFGSDDSLMVWFNGQQVISRKAARGAAPDQDVVTVNLKPGTNSLLMKIYNRSGGCGFYFAAGDTPAVQAGTSKATRKAEKLAAKTQSGDGPVATAAFDPNPTALRLAIQDLMQNHPDTFKNGSEYLTAVATFEAKLANLKTGLEKQDPVALAELAKFEELRRKVLLSNPALDFDTLLFIKRQASNLGLPANWQGNSSLKPAVENEIATLAFKQSDARPATLYKPAQNWFVGDVDLNFDADKMLFSSIGTQNRWQVFEIKADGTGLRQVSKGTAPDVDNYDPMYLPDGRIIYDSSSTFQGVPCVGGKDYVANLHIMNADGTGIRRLCFDQDNDWCPVMLPNGRVLYLRWEYTDSSHYFSRVLMSMNPDGTGQTEFYGSDSYWPNSLFYARPLPGSATKFVGIVSGHHGVRRMGEMVLFDAAKGRQEDSGAIQRIPGYGKPVQGIIKDRLVDDSWPRFLHPYPITDKLFLVAAQLTAKSTWGIYLADIYDNLVLLKQEPGYALLEPLPLRKTTRPPAIADKVNTNDPNASVYIHNIYAGDGLKGVPPGTVKSLRVFQYEYAYRNMGGHYYVGMEGPWDVRRIIGTVPVCEDGSVMFKIPANRPVAVQPLDSQGQALQQMRSWFVGMPGENVSCVGCHEKQNQSTALTVATAARMNPVLPTPWHGPKRGFSFLREVQPVLDQYCVGCHDGQGKAAARPNFAVTNVITTSSGITSLPKSYTELHPYVRRNGPEGDYHTLTPLEFHVRTSLLVQMLRKNHYNVKLDDVAWDRLVTWIDLNVPAYGSFSEGHKIPNDFEARRRECKLADAGVDEDIETLPPLPNRPAFVKPAPLPPRPAAISLAGWPLSPASAQQKQATLSPVDTQLDLGGGAVIRLKRIPAGEFVMGDVAGDSNEYPEAKVKIGQPFYLGVTEVTLQQYQQFDPVHRNGYYDQHYKDQVRPGYLMDSANLPVIRVSWSQAMGFCRWLSQRTGKKVTLPTEAQWEWAARAGSSKPFYYGGLDSDFSTSANLADATLSQMAVKGVDPKPVKNADKFWDYLPKETRFNDGVLMLAEVGRYQPNAWGVHDLIGNVAEWTLDDYRPYPYSAGLAMNDAVSTGPKTVRGGSWSERPKESRSSSRLDYPAWQKVYNVGFRVVVLD